MWGGGKGQVAAMRAVEGGLRGRRGEESGVGRRDRQQLDTTRRNEVRISSDATGKRARNAESVEEARVDVERGIFKGREC